MQTRTLGGEAGRRGFFGGTQGKTRTVGLIVVAIAGAFATILLQTPGLVATVLAAGVVYLATIRTHRGSPLVRFQARQRWAERQRTGTVDFAPVATRPEHVDGTPQGRGRAAKAQAAREWARYRDWPDGAEGMHWLQRGRGEPVHP